MPLQNKRSDTPGNRANLVYGEIAHQRADDLLLLRGDNKKIEVDLDRWRRRAPPAAGEIGAPLTPDGTGVRWASELGPSGRIDGVIAVDLPPVSYGVPGFIPKAVSGSIVLGGNAVITETFYVASDQITLTALAFEITSGGSSPIRLGVFTSNGQLVASNNITTPVVGINEVTTNTPLPRGTYIAMLWSGGSAIIKTISGAREAQGYAVEPLDGTRLFTTRSTGTEDMSGGMYFGEPGDFVPITSSLPGEDKSIMMRWTL